MKIWKYWKFHHHFTTIWQYLKEVRFSFLHLLQLGVVEVSDPVKSLGISSWGAMTTYHQVLGAQEGEGVLQFHLRYALSNRRLLSRWWLYELPRFSGRFLWSFPGGYREQISPVKWDPTPLHPRRKARKSQWYTSLHCFPPQLCAWSDHAWFLRRKWGVRVIGATNNKQEKITQH